MDSKKLLDPDVCLIDPQTLSALRKELTPAQRQYVAFYALRETYVHLLWWSRPESKESKAENRAAIEAATGRRLPEIEPEDDEDDGVDSPLLARQGRLPLHEDARRLPAEKKYFRELISSEAGERAALRKHIEAVRHAALREGLEREIKDDWFVDVMAGFSDGPSDEARESLVKMIIEMAPLFHRLKARAFDEGDSGGEKPADRKQENPADKTAGPPFSIDVPSVLGVRFLVIAPAAAGEVAHFIAETENLSELLRGYQEYRAKNLKALTDGDQTVLNKARLEWIRIQTHLTGRLERIYRHARRLELPTDPAPLLRALSDEDEKAIEAAQDTLYALTLDAQVARRPGGDEKAAKSEKEFPLDWQSNPDRHKIPYGDAEGLRLKFLADQARIGKGDVALAFRYWLDYPLYVKAVKAATPEPLAGEGAAKMNILERGKDDMRRDRRKLAGERLNETYEIATRLLMREAVKHDLDADTLHKCAYYTRRLCGGDNPTEYHAPAGGDIWPACLLQMPLADGGPTPMERKLLQTGESVFLRLVFVIDAKGRPWRVEPIGRYNPKERRKWREWDDYWRKAGKQAKEYGEAERRKWLAVTDTAPPRCTKTTAPYDERIAWWARMAAEAGISHDKIEAARKEYEHRGLNIWFTPFPFEPEILGYLRRLKRQEAIAAQDVDVSAARRIEGGNGKTPPPAVIDAKSLVPERPSDKPLPKSEAVRKKASWLRYVLGIVAIASVLITYLLLVDAYAEGKNLFQKAIQSASFLPYVGGAIVIIFCLFFGKAILHKIWPLGGGE